MGILLVILFIFILIIIFLIVKYIILISSLKEIIKDLSFILKEDTNQLITISKNNKQLKEIIKSLNKNLKELRKEKLKYRKGNQELNSLITNLTHDLRTPLTAIVGYSNLLKKEIKDKKDLEYLEIISRKAKELTELTEELFDYSKLIDTKKEIFKEEICLNEILEETIISYYEILNEHQIKPIIKICEEKVIGEYNKNSIIRILDNIISNTIKYSTKDLVISLDKKGTIIFSNHTNQLDKVSVEKLFDRYYTVQNAKQSSGVGLSIARQLAELNGGVIKANYEAGILEIKISFPVKRIKD